MKSQQMPVVNETKDQRKLHILVSVTVIADGICDGIIVKQTFCHMSEGLASRVNNRFYRKFVDIGGIPILCPDTVDDVTLATYGYLIRNIFDHLRPDIRFAVRNLNIRISVAGKSQTFCDMPEIRFEELASGKTCWSDKIHGVTYNDVILVLEREGIYACGTDQPGRNNSKTGRVIMHEFSHAINKAVDWGFEDLKMMLDEAYFGALEAGLMDNLKISQRIETITRIWLFLLYICGSEAAYNKKCDLSIKHLCYLTGDLARTIDGQFYGKFVDIQGLLVLSSHQVSDLTLASYGYLMDIVVSHLSSDVRSSLVRRGFRFAIVGQSESFCDIPEIAVNYYIAPMKPCSRPGIQGVTFKTLIVVSEGRGLQACDGFHNSSKTGRVMIHELTHAINLVIDDELEYLKNSLDSAYLNALANNLMDDIKDKSRAHYFTWGFMTYINANECNPNSYVYRDRLCTKTDLRQYDVDLYQLIENVVQNLDWSYSCDDVCSQDQIYKYQCN
uniref:Uncharacterized protein n=1 Tax=Romanomermis culicivorax TaxID=13658 RepID=A0A915KKE4_ROMCU